MVLDIFRIKQQTEDEVDDAIDKYLEPKHHLMGNDLDLQVVEEKPILNFEVMSPKEKKPLEVIEIDNVGKRKNKSGKLF